QKMARSSCATADSAILSSWSWGSSQGHVRNGLQQWVSGTGYSGGQLGRRVSAPQVLLLREAAPVPNGGRRAANRQLTCIVRRSLCCGGGGPALLTEKGPKPAGPSACRLQTLDLRYTKVTDVGLKERRNSRPCSRCTSPKRRSR